MGEMKCSCGGTFQSLGPEFIRTGEVSGYSLLTGHAGNDWAEGAIPGELFACDRCRTIRFCADEAWIAQRIQENQEMAQRIQRGQERLAAQREDRIQKYMKDFAGYSEKRLTKIAENDGMFGYEEEGREAARRLLEQKRSQPQSQNDRWKDWN